MSSSAGKKQKLQGIFETEKESGLKIFEKNPEKQKFELRLSPEQVKNILEEIKVPPLKILKEK